MSLLGSAKRKRKRKRNRSHEHISDHINFLDSILNADSPFDPWSLSIAEFEKVINSFKQIFSHGVFFDQVKSSQFIYQRNQAIHSIWLYMNFSIYCHYYHHLGDFPSDKFQMVINLDKSGSFHVGEVIRTLNSLSNEQFKVSSSSYRFYQELLQVNACLFSYWHLISENIAEELLILHMLFPLQLNEDKLAICSTFANAKHGQIIPTEQTNHLKMKIIRFLEKQFALYPSPFRPPPFTANFHLHNPSGLAQDFPLAFPNCSIEICGDSHFIDSMHNYYIQKHVFKEIIFEDGMHLFMDTHLWKLCAPLIVRTLQFPQVYAFAIEFSNLMRLRSFVRDKMVYAQKRFTLEVEKFCEEQIIPFFIVKKILSNQHSLSAQMAHFTTNQYLLAFHELFRLDKQMQELVDKQYLQKLLHSKTLRSHPFFTDLHAEIQNEEIMRQVCEVGWQSPLNQSLPEKIQLYEQSLLPIREKRNNFLDRALPTSEIIACQMQCRKKLLDMVNNSPDICDVNFLGIMLHEPLESDEKAPEEMAFAESPFEELFQGRGALTPQRKMAEFSLLPPHLHLQPSSAPHEQLSHLMRGLQIKEPQIENFLKKKGSP